MLSSLSSEARQNRLVAEQWRTDILEALSSSATTASLGEEASARLYAHADQAGVLALTGRFSATVSKRYSSEAENGVYIIPVHPKYRGANIHVRGSQDSDWTLPSFADDTCGLTEISESSPGIHAIYMPSQGGLAKYTRENTAVLAHELVHVEQAKRATNWGDLFDRTPASSTASEAEAYHTQFEILNSSLGGVLDKVCNATLQYGDILRTPKSIVVPLALTSYLTKGLLTQT